MGTLSWVGLLGLGALHGLNPGMGWLFAVAKGLQERERRAVWRAVVPLAAGHGLAIGATLMVAVMAGLALEPRAVRWWVAGFLIVMGAWHLVRPFHVRARGMRIGSREIALWSFLMSVAHGAGLMVVPLVLADGDGSAHAHHGGSAAALGMPALSAAALHTAGYLVTMAVVAVVVYERLGLRMLRSLWFNVDAVWAVGLIVTAGVVLAR